MWRTKCGSFRNRFIHSYVVGAYMHFDGHGFSFCSNIFLPSLFRPFLLIRSSSNKVFSLLYACFRHHRRRHTILTGRERNKQSCQRRRQRQRYPRRLNRVCGGAARQKHFEVSRRAPSRQSGQGRSGCGTNVSYGKNPKNTNVRFFTIYLGMF